MPLRQKIPSALGGFKEWRLPYITELKRFSRRRTFPWLRRALQSSRLSI